MASTFFPTKEEESNGGKALYYSGLGLFSSWEDLVTVVAPARVGNIYSLL